MMHVIKKAYQDGDFVKMVEACLGQPEEEKVKKYVSLEIELLKLLTDSNSSEVLKDMLQNTLYDLAQELDLFESEEDRIEGQWAQIDKAFKEGEYYLVPLYSEGLEEEKDINNIAKACLELQFDIEQMPQPCNQLGLKKFHNSIVEIKKLQWVLHRKYGQDLIDCVRGWNAIGPDDDFAEEIF